MSQIDTKKILILEDNLYALSALLKAFGDLEQELLTRYGSDIAVTVHSTMHVLKSEPKESYDVIILDRDDKEGVSFHDLEWDELKTDTVIGISTIDEWNQVLERMGVQHIVRKDFLELENWANNVAEKAKEILSLR